MLNRFAPLLAVLCLTSPVFAYDTESSAGSSAGIDRILRGTKQLSLDVIFVIDYSQTGDNSSLRTTVLGGGAFRYFVRNNLAVGIALDAYYKHSSTSTQTGTSADKEAGGLLLVTLQYFARLGDGFFLRPGFGIGGYTGSHWTPVDGSASDNSTSVYGGAATVDLGLVLYAKQHVSFHVVPQIIIFAGSNGTDTVVNVDGGFNVGFTYSF